MSTNDTKETKPVAPAAAATPTANAATPGGTAATVPAEEDSLKGKTSFDVVNSGGVVARTYTVEEHGPKARKLAEEYAGKIGGSVN